MQVSSIQLDQDTRLTVVTFSDADLADPEPTQIDKIIASAVKKNRADGARI